MYLLKGGYVSLNRSISCSFLTTPGWNPVHSANELPRKRSTRKRMAKGPQLSVRSDCCLMRFSLIFKCSFGAIFVTSLFNGSIRSLGIGSPNEYSTVFDRTGSMYHATQWLPG